MRARRHLFGEYGLLGKYKQHPDPNQEQLFFGLLQECLDQGIITESLLRDEMSKNHIRHDIFGVIEQSKPLQAPPKPPINLEIMTPLSGADLRSTRVSD